MSPILGGRGAGVRAYGFGGAAKPNAPVSVVATDVGTNRAYNNGAASVAFSSGGDNGAPITSYTVTSSPGSFTATGSSSPLTVTGLQSGVQYTYTVTATNAVGTSSASSASTGVTATTIPQVPTITSATRSSNTAVSIAFTGATGGSALTAVTATSSPSVSITSSGTSSPMTATATYAQSQSYTFTITATNANGTSSSSSASSSVTPFPAPALGAWTSGTAWPMNGQTSATGNGNGSYWWAGGGIVQGEVTLSTAIGYYWNGTGFTYGGAPNVVVWPSMGRANNTTSNSAYFTGGYDFGAGSTYSASYTLSNPGTFTVRTSYPVINYSMGLASLVNNGTMRSVGGAQAGTNSYYITTLGGNWTASGVTSPFITNSPTVGVDNNFGGEGWYFAKTTATPYKVTSATSAFTAMTNAPWGANVSNPIPLATVVGSSVIVMSNSDSYLNPYIFNGSTYTAQTAWPVSGEGGELAGGQSSTNLLRLVKSNRTAIGRNPLHYTSTLA